MKSSLAATILFLSLTGGSAYAAADTTQVDAAAALFEAYAVAEPDVAFDTLYTATDAGVASNPALVEELAPEVIERAEADNPGSDDDFGDFTADTPADVETAPAAETPATSAPVSAAPAEASAPAPEVAASQAAPAVPEGWISYDKLGLGFAVPPDFTVVTDEDDEFLVANTALDTPHGCAVMGQFDRDGAPMNDLPPGAQSETLPDHDLGFGQMFSVGRFVAELDGTTLRAMAIFSKQPFRDDEYFQIAVSCANVTAEDADTVMSGVLGSAHLTAQPNLPVPAVEEPRLGGLLTAVAPEGWTNYRSNEEEWTLIEPSFQAAVGFQTGYEALSSLRDLVPDERFRTFEAEPKIYRDTMFGEEGWVLSGDMAPDDPERGVYNGGLVGPISYFIADRCTPAGDAFVTSMSAQRSWIEGGNSLDPFLATVVMHWPEGEAICSDEVVKAKADAIVKGGETPQASSDAAAEAPTPNQADSPSAAEADASVSADIAPDAVVVDEPATWQTYENRQFGTAISYPADLFDSKTDMEAGDGRTFKTADGKVELAVFAVLNVKSLTIDDRLKDAVIADELQVVSGLTRISDSKFRLDGMREGQRFLHIEMFGATNVDHVLIVRYSDDYAETIEKIADTLHEVIPTAAQPVAAPASSDTTIELAFWNSIKDSTDPADFEAYLVQYPQGAFVALAQNRLKRLPAAETMPPASTAVEAPPVSETGAGIGPQGIYSSAWGDIAFTADADGMIRADYEGGQSHITGRMQGDTLSGRWVEPSSNRRCADGSYSGHVELTFAVDFSSFEGSWGYCDDVPRTGLKGTRTADAAPTISAPTASVPVSTAPAADEHDWQTYFNDRYGTVIDYPADIFVPQPPPDNNDGRQFASRDGQSTFYVYAQYNAMGQSLQELYDADMSMEGQTVAYSTISEGWFVVSGLRNDEIFYRKTILSPDDLLQSFEISYQRQLKDAFGPIVERMEKSFGGEDVSDSADSGSVGPSGVYITDWGDGQSTDIQIQTAADGSVQGDYSDGTPGDSHVTGQMQGTTLTGRWMEPSSAQRCTDGAYWGRLELAFSADFSTLDGHWGYCDSPPDRAIKGELSGGDSPVSSQETSTQPQPAATSGPFSTPARGTAERQALMDAARGPISDDIGQKVIFVVKVLRSDGNWAYLEATPVQPNGSALDWNQTRYAADWKADAMSDTIMVLLSNSGAGWQVVDHIVGPTDVYWYSWIDQYQLPEALFQG